MSKIFGPLYKRDTKGKIRVWRMELDGNRYRTIAGLEDGQHVTSEWTVVEGKNIGRSNETTAEEQARSEVESHIKKKSEQGGYHVQRENVDRAKFFSPMTAKKYGEVDIKFPVYSQPKLDGMRCIINAEGMWSRQGKPIVSAPHIFKALEHWFQARPGLVLDGELYNHKLKDDFAKIMSLCKKQKPKPAELEESAEMVQFWVYDVPSLEDGYGNRYEYLEDLLEGLPDSIQLVPTHKPENQEELDACFEEYLADGYEGQMVRTNGTYESKRSKRLLKRKNFEDAEFTILRIEEGKGNRTGMAGRVIFDYNGEECKASMIGSHAYCREVLAEADQYIGGEVTVDFFGYSKEDGLPRFPRAKILYKGKRDV